MAWGCAAAPTRPRWPASGTAGMRRTAARTSRWTCSTASPTSCLWCVAVIVLPGWVLGGGRAGAGCALGPPAALVPTALQLLPPTAPELACISCPHAAPAAQVFVVADGGADLEHFELRTFEEVRSILLQARPGAPAPWAGWRGASTGGRGRWAAGAECSPLAACLVGRAAGTLTPPCRPAPAHHLPADGAGGGGGRGGLPV